MLKIMIELPKNPDLLVDRMAAEIRPQLAAQGRKATSPYRYHVRIKIAEGQRRPAADVDNYAKAIHDAITRTQLLWRDDEQVDRLLIERTLGRSRTETAVTVEVTRVQAQHSGVPTWFRASCLEARCQRVQGGYATPAYRLACVLASECPYDVDGDVWAKRIERLQEACAEEDRQVIWDWFRAHFPKFMKLVPRQAQVPVCRWCDSRSPARAN